MRLRSALCLALLAVPAAAAGDVHKVPQDHPTIQDAVTAAADGDTILISAGTYAESVTVTSKNNLLIQGKGKVVIDPPSGVGLLLDGCDGCTVDKIRVGGGDPGFSLVNCTNCGLLKCRSDLAAVDGIGVDGGQDNAIAQCTVTGAGNSAIALGLGAAGATTTCLVLQCKLIKPANDGVAVRGTNNVIDTCSVVQAVDDAFVIDSGSPGINNTFQDCKAIQPGGRGLVATGDDNTFLRCKVVHNGDDPAVHVVSGDGNQVLECKLVKAAFEGVFLNAGTTNTHVHDCKISGASSDGIQVDGDLAEIMDNKISGAHGSGCVLDGDNSEWSGNSATGSHADGFLIDAAAAGNHLTGNKAKGSHGFDLDDLSNGANAVDLDNSFKTKSP